MHQAQNPSSSLSKPLLLSVCEAEGSSGVVWHLVRSISMSPAKFPRVCPMQAPLSSLYRGVGAQSIGLEIKRHSSSGGSVGSGKVMDGKSQFIERKGSRKKKIRKQKNQWAGLG